MVSLACLKLQKRLGGGGGGGGGRGGGGSVGGGGRSSGSGSSSSGGRGSSGGSSSSGSTLPSSFTSPYPGRSGTPGTSSPSISRGTSGGGFPRTISPGSAFQGRQFGGAQRSQIYGGGYGYGGGLGRYAGYAGVGAGVGAGAAYVGSVRGVGFPYGYWPIYYGPHYYDDDEYGPYSNSSRPGGALTVASFSPATLNATTPPQYMLYGDEVSVGEAISALVEKCGAVLVVNNTAVRDDGSYAASPMAQGNETAALLPSLNPENVLEYYRASSFALYSFFTNQTTSTTNSSLPANLTLPQTQSTSSTFLYPSPLRSASFEFCVNGTIADALPIEDGYFGSGSGARRVSLTGRRGEEVEMMALLLAVVFGVNGGNRTSGALVAVVMMVVVLAVVPKA
ncbi:hypothetical protein JCM11641_002059 [Rhodosporidiobolus odoratus]